MAMPTAIGVIIALRYDVSKTAVSLWLVTVAGGGPTENMNADDPTSGKEKNPQAPKRSGVMI